MEVELKSFIISILVIKRSGHLLSIHIVNLHSIAAKIQTSISDERVVNLEPHIIIRFGRVGHNINR